MLNEFQNRLVPNVHKIAVLRANAIGDLTFILPALEALKAAYPEAEIVLLGQRWHADFLNGRPGPIDRVIAVPPCRGVTLPDDTDVEGDPRQLDRFYDAMQRERFDIAIQLHGGGRYSNPFLLRLGARLTVGLKSPEADPLDRWLPYIYFQSEVIRYLEVVFLVGARPLTTQPTLSVMPADLEEARRVLPDAGVPLVILHPGAGDPTRRWTPERFAAVGDALARAGALVAVNGGRLDERPVVQHLLSSMKYEAIDLWGRLSLGGLLGLLSRSQLLVSNDSGPLHLAAAVGTPSVGVFWCGNMLTAGLLNRALHRPAISWRIECPVCGKHIINQPCEHFFSYVADVPVEEVTGYALELLSAAKNHTPVAMQYREPSTVEIQGYA